MKLRLLICLIALLGGGLVSKADTTVATPPMGYFKLNARASSDSMLSVPLVRRSVLLARVNLVSAADTLVLDSQSLVDGAFAPSVDGSYYLQILSGSLRGLYYKITGNTGSAIVLETLGDDLTAHALGAIVTGSSGDLVRICPFWTVRDLFGADETGLTVAPKATAESAAYTEGDEICFFDNSALGAEKRPANAIGFITGTGWRARGGVTDAGGQEVKPGQGIVFRRQGSTQLDIAVIGSVPMDPLVTRLAPISSEQEMDVVLGLAHPIELKLGDSQLFSVDAGSVVNATTNPLSPADLLLDYSGNRQGFSLPPDARFHVEGTGWFQGNDPAGEYLLGPGKGYILRLRGQHSIRYWTQIPAY